MRFSLLIALSGRARGNLSRIHLMKRGRDAERFDVRSLAETSKDFSGAEIEEAIISGLYDAFYARQKRPYDATGA